MKNTTAIFLILGLFFLCVFSVNAQSSDRIELDASALTAGQGFRFTVTVNSEEQLAFTDARARLTAVLCPAGQSSGECQIMNMSPTSESDTTMQVIFSVDELPTGGDYTLDVSFLDESGTFETKTGEYLLVGVKDADPMMAPAADPTAAPAMPEEVVTRKVTLQPELLDASGTSMVYGSTLYVEEPYTLRLRLNSAMDDGTVLEMTIPASFASAPVDPTSDCLRYLDADRTALILPGGLWNEENGNTFTCELRFSDSAYLTAQPFTFALCPAEETAAVRYEMDALSWNYYPVNIAKMAATHQLQISDSRGNLICSDTVPCGYFDADDVYTVTYKFPADWGGALPSGQTLTAEMTCPENWFGLLSAENAAMASGFGNACQPDSDGVTRLVLDEMTAGRYSASCTFVPSGITNPRQEAARLHLNDNRYQVSDLSVYLPGTIVKREAALTPSLTLRMTAEDAASEQISGGWLNTLYRTTESSPNSGSSDGPALYTLRAVVDGVSSARTPQDGDHVTVEWSVLDALVGMGDLPSCLVPAGQGYILGELSRNDSGQWEAQCDFRFPDTMSESLQGGSLRMQLESGMYSTASTVNMNGLAFKNETLYVDLDIPTHMLMNQPTEFHVRLTDSTGGFSDYMRAVLNQTGVSLYSDWTYNYVTTCQGNYPLELDGTSACTAYFTEPILDESDMHFSLVNSEAGQLFNVVFRPAADIHVQAVSNIKASLTVKLFHAGTEMPLPAAANDSFVVSDDYQLRFYLTPDADFRDVLDAVSVDYEGLVQDWWAPLTIYWGAIPGGQTSLNFYRDGDHYIARYDFSFSEGNLLLEGNLSSLMLNVTIDGWDVDAQGSAEPILLPNRVDKKPLSLSISDFTVAGSDDTVADLHVNEEASFDVSFNGSLDSFDVLHLMVGYDANGIRTPLACTPDFDENVLQCSITAVCTDYSYDSYGNICGTNLSLYAVYNGDPVNQAAEAPAKLFNVKRNEISFTSASEGSLSKDDMISIQAAGEGLQAMGYGSLQIGGWNVDSFLPRQVRGAQDIEYRVYPVIFNYKTTDPNALDETQLRLDVTYNSGSAALPVESTISLKPRMVTDDSVYFELDFGSMELLDDGRTVQRALEDAVTIESLTVRYAGSTLMGPASAKYEAEDLTFALKVADLLDMRVDLSFPATIRFDGNAASETMLQPFTVYCSQLLQPLECSAEPQMVTYDEEGNELLSEFPTDNCWGKIQMSPGTNEIYADGIWNPICYLTAWSNGRQILIATNAAE